MVAAGAQRFRCCDQEAAVRTNRSGSLRICHVRSHTKRIKRGYRRRYSGTMQVM